MLAWVAWAGDQTCEPHLKQPTPDLTPPRLDQKSQRTLLAYRIASLAILFVGLLWAAIFAFKGWWSLSFAEVILACIGLASWLLVRSGRLTEALLVSEFAFLAFAIGFCAMFDIPTAEGPRVSHLYLPVLALLGYINYLRNKSPLQLVVIVACLAAFIAFSSAPLALPFAEPIPADIRPVGTWVNAILATALVCACIYAMQLESMRNENGMARDLRAAIRNDELELVLQPQVDEDGQLIGAEALLRWTHPQRGAVSPGVFIPAAEEGGVMPLLGGWVLKEACRILAKWKEDPALCEFRLAVNVSAIQFRVDGFEHSVLDTVSLYGIDPRRLKLELTESVVISGMDMVVAKMEALRIAGIGFSLDDFGTGYSSLSYLRQLPVEQIKIDRSFVKEASESAGAVALVRSIVHMGRDLGLVVLAEGVETEEQYHLLRDCGCQQFQGYYFGRPMSRALFEEEARKNAAQTETPAAPESDRRDISLKT